jgi:hypothetical protein
MQSLNKIAHCSIGAERLQDQAEAIEREKQEAVNAVNAKHFEETQRGGLYPKPAFPPRT